MANWWYQQKGANWWRASWFGGVPSVTPAPPPAPSIPAAGRAAVAVSPARGAVLRYGGGGGGGGNSWILVESESNQFEVAQETELERLQDYYLQRIESLKEEIARLRSRPVMEGTAAPAAFEIKALQERIAVLEAELEQARKVSAVEGLGDADDSLERSLPWIGAGIAVGVAAVAIPDLPPVVRWIGAGTALTLVGIGVYELLDS